LPLRITASLDRLQEVEVGDDRQDGDQGDRGDHDHPSSIWLSPQAHPVLPTSPSALETPWYRLRRRLRRALQAREGRRISRVSALVSRKLTFASSDRPTCHVSRRQLHPIARAALYGLRVLNRTAEPNRRTWAATFPSSRCNEVRALEWACNVPADTKRECLETPTGSWTHTRAVSWMR
jgi:hypothetical protein